MPCCHCVMFSRDKVTAGCIEVFCVRLAEKDCFDVPFEKSFTLRAEEPKLNAGAELTQCKEVFFLFFFMLATSAPQWCSIVVERPLLAVLAW